MDPAEAQELGAVIDMVEKEEDAMSVVNVNGVSIGVPRRGLRTAGVDEGQADRDVIVSRDVMIREALPVVYLRQLKVCICARVCVFCVRGCVGAHVCERECLLLCLCVRLNDGVVASVGELCTHPGCRLPAHAPHTRAQLSPDVVCVVDIRDATLAQHSLLAELVSPLRCTLCPYRKLTGATAPAAPGWAFKPVEMEVRKRGASDVAIGRSVSHGVSHGGGACARVCARPCCSCVRVVRTCASVCARARVSERVRARGGGGAARPRRGIAQCSGCLVSLTRSWARLRSTTRARRACS